jgi:hypothetical protein
LLNLKEHNIQNKAKRLIKDLSKRSLVVKPAQKIAILNNPQSNLTFENLKYLQKALQRNSSQLDIFTFKSKTDHYNELRGIVADKSVFSSFGKIKSPEIKDFRTPVGPLAQLVEQFPFKEWVDGSSPSRLTNFKKLVDILKLPHLSKR